MTTVWRVSNVIHVQREAWRHCGKEILPMWQGEHARETVHQCDHRLEVNPALGSFTSLELAKILLVITARDDKLLVGYTLTCFLPDFSCKHLLMANVMIHYVTPAYRGKGIARRMFHMIETETRLRHGAAVMAGNKAHLPHGKVFEHMQYHPYGTTYIKWMDDDARTYPVAQTAQSLQET